jgi:hypothetical protein
MCRMALNVEHKSMILSVADGEWPVVKTDGTGFLIAQYRPTINTLCLWLIRKES